MCNIDLQIKFLLIKYIQIQKASFTGFLRAVMGSDVGIRGSLCIRITRERNKEKEDENWKAAEYLTFALTMCLGCKCYDYSPSMVLNFIRIFQMEFQLLFSEPWSNFLVYIYKKFSVKETLKNKFYKTCSSLEF